MYLEFSLDSRVLCRIVIGQLSARVEGERLMFTYTQINFDERIPTSRGYINLPSNCPILFSSSAVLRTPLLCVTHFEGVTGEAAGEATAEEAKRPPRRATVGRTLKLSIVNDVRRKMNKN